MKKIKQSTHKAIYWLPHTQIKELFEQNGKAIYSGETTDDLRETLRQCVIDGDFSEETIENL